MTASPHPAHALLAVEAVGDAAWDGWWLLTGRWVAGRGGRALTTREL